MRSFKAGPPGVRGHRKKLAISVLTPVLVVYFATANGGTLNPRQQGEARGHGRDKRPGTRSDEARCRKQTHSSKDSQATSIQEHKMGSYMPGVHRLVYTSHLFLCFSVYKGKECYLPIYPQHLRRELGTQ